MSPSVYEFEPVLGISPRDSVSLILHSAIIATVPSRMASSLISEASIASPMPPHLKHLKRVRPSRASDGKSEPHGHLDLILHACDTKGKESSLGQLPESIAALVVKHGLVPFVAKVPLLAPETREQWQEWGQEHWPMVWKVPEKTSMSHPPEATKEEEEYFKICMSRVLDLSPGSSNAALIVNPAAFTASSFHPDSPAWVAGGVHSDKNPLAHAVMEAVVGASVRDKKLWPISSLEEKKLASLEEDEGASSKRQKLEPPSMISPLVGSRPYMCTGYDIFIKREPCIMCAMALVHSRLARVIYCESDLSHGALGGAMKLHSKKSLNHHYHVYLLEQQKD